MGGSFDISYRAFQGTAAGKNVFPVLKRKL
jgi:hypothetical protein